MRECTKRYVEIQFVFISVDTGGETSHTETHVRADKHWTKSNTLLSINSDLFSVILFQVTVNGIQYSIGAGAIDLDLVHSIFFSNKYDCCIQMQFLRWFLIE